MKNCENAIDLLIIGYKLMLLNQNIGYIVTYDMP